MESYNGSCKIQILQGLTYFSEVKEINITLNMTKLLGNNLCNKKSKLVFISKEEDGILMPGEV